MSYEWWAIHDAISRLQGRRFIQFPTTFRWILLFKPDNAHLTQAGYPAGTTCWCLRWECCGKSQYVCNANPEDCVHQALDQAIEQCRSSWGRRDLEDVQRKILAELYEALKIIQLGKLLIYDGWIPCVSQLPNPNQLVKVLVLESASDTEATYSEAVDCLIPPRRGSDIPQWENVLHTPIFWQPHSSD